MADNFEQGQEVIIGNRRMRKIKRPKPQTAPISSAPVSSAPVYHEPPAAPAPEPVAPSTGSVQPYQEPEPQYNRYDTSYSQPSSSPYIEPEDDTYDEAAYEPQQNVSYDMVSRKKTMVIALICAVVGVFIGKLLFGAPQVVQQGLQGVVLNPEVPKGRSRCGMVEKTQGCVLYVMNPQRQEMNGRDFYDLAAQQTGRQRFVIETGNMRYSSAKIRPGSIAQLNIPPLQ